MIAKRKADGDGNNNDKKQPKKVRVFENGKRYLRRGNLCYHIETVERANKWEYELVECINTLGKRLLKDSVIRLIERDLPPPKMKAEEMKIPKTSRGEMRTRSVLENLDDDFVDFDASKAAKEYSNRQSDGAGSTEGAGVFDYVEEEENEMTACPVCKEQLPTSQIQGHAEICNVQNITDDEEGEGTETTVTVCPLCGKGFGKSKIEQHAAQCMDSL